MIRHLIPRLSYGRWGGGALTDDGSPHGDEAHGRALCIQWLGVLVEIGVGIVR